VTLASQDFPVFRATLVAGRGHSPTSSNGFVPAVVGEVRAVGASVIARQPLSIGCSQKGRHSA